MAERPFGDYLASLRAGFLGGDVAAVAKVEESANMQALDELITAIGSEDLETIGRLLADDVRLEIHSHGALPFIDTAEGKPAFLRALQHNFGQLINQRPQIESVVAQGDTVVVIGREQGELAESGAGYDVYGVHRYVFREGQLVLVQEFLVPA
jgi:ketosteroid isomerase-like protein